MPLKCEFAVYKYLWMNRHECIMLPPMKKHSSRTLLMISTTLIIFHFIFTKINFHLVVEVLSHAIPFYVALSLAVLTISVPLGVKHWQVILKVTGHPLPFWRCFNIFMASLPLTFITPFKSGDVVKAYFILKWNFSIFGTCLNLIENVVGSKQK